MKRSLLIVLCLSLWLGACTVNREPGAHPEQTGMRNYRTTDGDNNFTRQNPNIIVGDPVPRTINNDVRRIKWRAEQVNGVQRATVAIGGGTAWIAIAIDRHLTDDQMAAVADEVRSEVGAMMPRYELRIISYRGR